MSKKQRIANRKCSALLTAGVGAAVCLTGGGPAHAANGLLSASNGGNSSWGPAAVIKLFGSKASASLSSTAFFLLIISNGGTLRFGTNGGGTVSMLNAGVSVTPGFSFAAFGGLTSATNKYYPMRFNDSGLKFGWVHVVSRSGANVQMDTWAYNTLGNSIKTLSDSVTTNRLALTGGKEKLYWTNDNEDGVARYEVQSQDASGEWQAADSDVPGSGSYSAKVDSGKTCRLVVEMTDGSTKEIDF